MENIKLLSHEELAACIELGKKLTSELDGDQLFSTILKKLSHMIPADIWSLLLYDRDTEELSFKLSVDLDIEKVRHIRLGSGEGIAGWVAQAQEPLIVEDVNTCQHFSKKIDVMSGTETRSVMCVPLVFAGTTVGVIEAVNPYSTDKKALTLLMFIADYAAIAVENTRRYEHIRNMAIHDNLTGLYNTRYFYQALEDLITGSMKSQSPFSLIFMDLDNFKNVVDTHGHLNGSQAIQEVALTIRDCIKEPEFGVSYGGDEFVVVLPGYSKKMALAKAEEIRDLISHTMYLCNHDLNVRISASMGVATFPDDSTQLSGIIGMADRAMFKVKGTGKNAVSGDI